MLDFLTDIWDSLIGKIIVIVPNFVKNTCNFQRR